jgi:multidrug efflux system membrane fusion protein
MQIPRPALSSQNFKEAAQDIPGTVRRASSDPVGRLILGIAGVVLLIGVVWYFFGSSKPEEKKRPPAPVLIARVMEKSVTVQEPAIGTVVANATVQLTPQVEGRLFSAEFKEGQIVKRGDILFRIDPRPFDAAVQQAEATLARDQAQLMAAQNDKTRYAALFAQKAVSASQRDQAVASANALAATVKADRALLAVAQLNREYAVIRSPIDGKTGPILVQPGNLVSASGGIGATAASPLVVITQFQPVKVSFALPQSDLPRIEAQAAKDKLTATVQVHGAPETMRKAKVDFTSNAVDDKTGTIELRATFPNADSMLVPGQLVDVAVSLADLEHVPVVPSSAVNEGPNGRYVYVIGKGDKAEMRPVTVLNDDGKVAALQGKIKPGERVVTDGQMRVVPGGAVVIKNDGAHKGQRQKS